MQSLQQYINESRKTSSLKNAYDKRTAQGYTFYKIGLDTNGNPLWCVKKDAVSMDKKTANSLGFRSNKIKDENGKTIEVWTCQSYSVPETAKYMKKAEVQVIKESKDDAPHPFNTLDSTKPTRVTVSETNDTWYEVEARYDDWVIIRGTYDGGFELDEILNGHSGHGSQVSVTDKIRDWFDDNLQSELEKRIKSKISNGDVKKLDDDEDAY